MNQHLIVALIVLLGQLLGTIRSMFSGFTRGRALGAANPWLGSFWCHSHTKGRAHQHSMTWAARHGAYSRGFPQTACTRDRWAHEMGGGDGWRRVAVTRGGEVMPRLGRRRLWLMKAAAVIKVADDATAAGRGEGCE